MTWLLGTIAELAAARQPRVFPPTPVPEPVEYVDARTEARNLCRNLGLDVDNQHWDSASVGDFIRYAYAQGWKACESRLSSPDIAEAIAVAIEHPDTVVDPLFSNESVVAHKVRAVQRAAVHGVPK
jgi:hypothetical protein